MGYSGRISVEAIPILDCGMIEYGCWLLAYALRWGVVKRKARLAPFGGAISREGEPRSGGTLQGCPGVSRQGFALKILKRVKRRARVTVVDNLLEPAPALTFKNLPVSDMTK